MNQSVWQQLEMIIIIGIGGFLGANARQWVSEWAAERFGTGFPWGTLLINVSGSFLLAIFLAWTGKHLALDARWRLFFAVGFCGAYTTFSTFAYNSVALAENGNWLASAGNVMSTNVLCLIAAWLGLVIGGRL